ncbi:MAG: lipopolysaccharide biosynthesis protein [Rikenellaceae bacterium]
MNITQSHNTNSIRIAKNTMMLYIRTVVTILVALYTSRVVLNTLGEVDYGVYSIVGGVVLIFTFAQTAMTNATQRFLNFEMGRGGDQRSVAKIFSVSFMLHIAIAVLIVLLGETVGLWFMLNKLNIPIDRVDAAIWVYQFSLFTAAVGILRVPFHATIIANEKMSFYAYVSIVESAFNILIVSVLVAIDTDKLILYSGLIFASSIVILVCYRAYCRKWLSSTTTFTLQRNKEQYFALVSFSGWSLMSSVSNVLAPQGLNILINLFFGVVVNAALGIATQVQMAVWAFANNFQMAFNPLLVQSYAAGEQRYFEKLICQTAKSSFMLLYIIVLPFYICAPTVLWLWLGEVPQYTLQFVRAFLLFLLFEATSSPMWVAVNGVGRIKWYQIILSVIIILNIPISWFLFKMGFDPISATVVKVCLAGVALVARVLYLRWITQFSLSNFVNYSILPILGVVVVSAPVAYYLSELCGEIIGAIVGGILAIVAIYFVGLTRGERGALNENIMAKMCHK